MILLMIVLGVVALLVFKAKGGRVRKRAKRAEGAPVFLVAPDADKTDSVVHRRFPGSRGGM